MMGPFGLQSGHCVRTKMNESHTKHTFTKQLLTVSKDVDTTKNTHKNMHNVNIKTYGHLHNLYNCSCYKEREIIKYILKAFIQNTIYYKQYLFCFGEICLMRSLM